MEEAWGVEAAWAGAPGRGAVADKGAAPVVDADADLTEGVVVAWGLERADTPHCGAQQRCVLRHHCVFARP